MHIQDTLTQWRHAIESRPCAVLLHRLEHRRIQKFFLVGRYPTLAEGRAVYDAVASECTILEMRQRSGVPLRRLQVILHWMRQAGIARRRASGYSRTAQQATNQDFERLIATFEKRSRTDRERLEEMMRYAQATSCRKQILRKYFGEPPGELCGVCDNCTDPSQENVSADGEVEVASADLATAFCAGVLV